VEISRDNGVSSGRAGLDPPLFLYGKHCGIIEVESQTIFDFPTAAEQDSFRAAL